MFLPTVKASAHEVHSAKFCDISHGIVACVGCAYDLKMCLWPLPAWYPRKRSPLSRYANCDDDAELLCAGRVIKTTLLGLMEDTQARKPWRLATTPGAAALFPCS